MRRNGICVADDNSGENDQDGHEDGPEKSHDRLLVPYLDITVRDHIDQLSIFV